MRASCTSPLVPGLLLLEQFMPSAPPPTSANAARAVSFNEFRLITISSQESFVRPVEFGDCSRPEAITPRRLSKGQAQLWSVPSILKFDVVSNGSAIRCACNKTVAKAECSKTGKRPTDIGVSRPD